MSHSHSQHIMSGVAHAAKAEVTAGAGAVVHEDVALDSKRIDTLPIFTIVRTSGRIETISISVNDIIIR
jgi:hypothetical protein